MFPKASAKGVKGGAFGGFATSSTTLSYLTPPPDFSIIPQDVVVPFKNLLKKDSTTKEKALQDILLHIQGFGSDGQGFDEPVIDAYVELYPRLSIDDSARVRELSHQLLFQLLNTAKKRMAKRLPAFVGAWLAGTFDRDKRVARAASDALSSFLPTREKEEAFWKAVQTRALNFAIEAIQETPDTLSDERSTTKEDSQAKYYRVIGASVSLALNLVNKGDIGVLSDGLGRYLGIDALWTMSKADDWFVRKALYRFLNVLLDVQPVMLEPRLQQVGKALVADGLRNSQTGSATDLLKVLVSLTKRFPQVWGTQKHSLQRLHTFVSQGSQSGAEEYWRSLDELLQTLPNKTPSVEVVSNFLGAMRKGIADRLELHTGRNQAFRSYARVFELFLGHMPLNTTFLEENLSSLTRQYLHPNPESPLPSPQRPEFLAEAWMTVARHSANETREAVAEEWQKLGSAFLSRMSNSLPEVSEGYKKSQNAIASEGERWFAFVANALSREDGRGSPLIGMITASSREVLAGALDLLSKRNFKPFGAASVIRSAFRHYPALCSDMGLLRSLFPANETETYAVIVASPSLSYLVSDLNTMSSGAEGRLGKIWTSLAEAALRLSDRQLTVSAIRVLIGIPSVATYAQQLAPLQAFLIPCWQQYADGGDASGLKDLCKATLAYDILNQDSTEAIAVGIVSSLEVPEAYQSALAALELILQEKPKLLSINDDLHVRLVAALLALTELSDTGLSEKARSLRSLLDNQPAGRNPIANIIESHLGEASSSSLEVDTLLQQALSVLSSGAALAEDIFPSSTIWMNELSGFLTRAPNPSLSIAFGMEGAYFLVKEHPNAKKQTSSRDSRGRSIPARMALFTAKLLSSGIQLSSLPPEFQLELVYLLCLTDALTEDQLTVPQADGLWGNAPEDEAEAQEFRDFGRKAVDNVVLGCGSWVDWDLSGGSLVERLINFMLGEAVGLSPGAFYTAKSLSFLLGRLMAIHDRAPSKLEEWLTRLGIMKPVPNNMLIIAAFVTGIREPLASSTAFSTLVNRLISEVSGVPGSLDTSTRALPSLVLLNICMDVYDYDVGIPIETRKQVLALQQFTRWMDSPEELGYQTATEICRAIKRLLPGVKETYGPYWEKTVKYCIWLWKKAAIDRAEERLPYVHASLELYRALRNNAEANDDLVDALATHGKATSAALVGLLSIPREATANVPSQITDRLLERIVSRMPSMKLDELGDIYEPVASESREIQKAAFGLLHKALPAAQEDINLAVVMDKKAANLPDELLSLLLNAPNPDDYSDEELSQFPVAIRSYLLAWHLVFDAYSTASFRVRNDYTDNLKSGKHLDPLLRFLVDVLGHALARPLDLDKEGFTAEHICSYNIDTAEFEPPERDMDWLLIHLFYLTLKYIPGLFKMWYLDCPSKQTKNSIQSWMQKYFSPLIISDALDEVVGWASNQEKIDADTQEIVVRVSKTMHEITAGYPIDDDVATISLHVPKSYPLDPVDVVSVKRVAVKEDRWQSWMKAIKAVIMFGNCSLVDGLTAFRRNISLAMKGQEECAICYSIIAPDRTLPDKKCGTCSHYFHRVCLYKWFQNSGRNTCPLCRNAIDYLGSDTKRRRPEHE